MFSALTTPPRCFPLMLGFASSCKIYDFSRACELRPKELVGTGKMCSFIKRFRYIETLSGAKNMVPYIKDFILLRFSAWNQTWNKNHSISNKNWIKGYVSIFCRLTGSALNEERYNCPYFSPKQRNSLLHSVILKSNISKVILTYRRWA